MLLTSEWKAEWWCQSIKYTHTPLFFLTTPSTQTHTHTHTHLWACQLLLSAWPLLNCQNLLSKRAMLLLLLLLLLLPPWCDVAAALYLHLTAAVGRPLPSHIFSHFCSRRKTRLWTTKSFLTVGSEAGESPQLLSLSPMTLRTVTLAQTYTHTHSQTFLFRWCSLCLCNKLKAIIFHLEPTAAAAAAATVESSPAAAQQH